MMIAPAPASVITAVTANAANTNAVTAAADTPWYRQPLWLAIGAGVAVYFLFIRRR